MAWNHAATRLFGLFEIWLATEVYSKFPVKKGGFSFDTVVLGRSGTIDRYIDQEGFDEFERVAKADNFLELLRGFKAYEDSVLPFFEKDPFENREEFMKIFRQLWIHEIMCFFLGLYATKEEAIRIISHLRGTKGAQHIATGEFLPKLYKQISEALHIDIELLKYALPDEIISLNLDPGVLALRQKGYVIEFIKGKTRLLVGDDDDDDDDDDAAYTDELCLMAELFKKLRASKSQFDPGNLTTPTLIFFRMVFTSSVCQLPSRF